MLQKLLSLFRRSAPRANRIADPDLVLRQMGNNPDQVAAFLRENNIKGVKFGCFYCPIATYLRSLLPKEVCKYPAAVCVSSSSYSITYYTSSDGPMVCQRGTLPLAASEFVFQFDHKNAYSDLEQPKKPLRPSWMLGD
jgi:hypothetical protein